MFPRGGGAKNQITIIIALTLGLFLPYVAIAESYPNRDTVILGDQGDITPQYELSLSAPETVQKNEHFEVHASFVATDNLISKATATLTTSNGVVLSDPAVELAPENVWELTTDEVGTLGIIIKIQTEYYSSKENAVPQVTFVDTLEKRVSVQSNPKNIEQSQPSAPAATSTNSSWWIGAGVIAIIGMVISVVIVKKRSRRAVDNKG